jgi:hypothetical protein
VEPGSQTLIAQGAAGVAVMSIGPTSGDVAALHIVLTEGE